jgi:hypothetical protein
MHIFRLGISLRLISTNPALHIEKKILHFQLQYVSPLEVQKARIRVSNFIAALIFYFLFIFLHFSVLLMLEIGNHSE